MPFYLRKSLNFGPLRFNLSNSGIGVSTGVKGFRVSAGPRGNYIHAGRGGFYYRATIPDSRPTPAVPSDQGDKLKEIESGNVLAMTDGDSSGLLTELNSKRGLWRWGPTALALGVVLLIVPFLLSEALLLSAVLFGIATAALVSALPLWMLDVRRKTTVLFYELEEPVLSAVQQLHTALDLLGSCQRIWLVEAEGTTTDWKRHSGATGLVNRSSVQPGESPPAFVKTNVRVLSLPAGRQRLYFFPDRLLVLDPNGYGAVAYDDLRCQIKSVRFHEDSDVPSDSRVVGQTWRYVNKKGGPDRRFNDNHQIPIVAYEELSLCSPTGLNEQFQLSREGASRDLPGAFAAVAAASKQESQPAKTTNKEI